MQNGIKVYSYVAIRPDESYREGYSSRHENLVVQLPFREAGIDKAGVMDLLDGVGIGLPAYYEWRSRSGCTFCFLPAEDRVGAPIRGGHPDLFEEAKAV